MQCSVIVFDVFGTLLTIEKRRSPYKRLLHALAKQGRRSQANDVSMVMSHCKSFAELAKFWGYEISIDLVKSLEADLAEELDSICLYDDTRETLLKLKSQGFKLALCSNLAMPYGNAVFNQLPSFDAYAMSYAVGATKPDPKIYQHLLNELHCDAKEMLFIGDTPKADVVGPTAFGMCARLIERKKGQTLRQAMSGCVDI